MSSTTINTQGLEDWTAKSWADFIWSPESCPTGYEAIGSTWIGIKPFNATDTSLSDSDDVSVDIDEDSIWDVEFPATSSRLQPGLFTGMTDVLCGKRGSLSFAESSLADRGSDGTYSCPEGKTACSS